MPNLQKYFFDISPTTQASEATGAVLPTAGMIMISNQPVLTLNFREYLLEENVNIAVQTSTDLQNWSTVNAPIIQTGTDETTGDPLMQAQVPTMAPTSSSGSTSPCRDFAARNQVRRRALRRPLLTEISLFTVLAMS